MLKNIIFVISIWALLFSCSYPTQKVSIEVEHSYHPKYAQFFKIDYYQDYKKLTVLNPWGNEQMNMEYYIAIDSVAIKKSDLSYSFRLKPVTDDVVALSSPIIGMLQYLKLGDHITGISDPALVYDSLIIAKLKNDEIEDVGKSIQLNMEKLMMLNPEIIIGSGWNNMSADYEKMITLKMTPVLMYDWQEIHPLGKAEWMVFLAAFFNKEQAAQKEFNKISEKYNHLKNSVSDNETPRIFNGSEYQGIWYSAGGQSYMSSLYKDAGANYILKNDSSKGSIQLDFEVIMQKAMDIPIWMYTGGIQPINTKLFYTPKYHNFQSIKNHQIYSFHKRTRVNGANDYFETASLRPDLVLQDLIKIFHPQEARDIEFYYFNEVKY